MHEYGIVQRLLNMVEQQARAHGCTAVWAVEIQLNALADTEPEALRHGFGAVAQGTVAEAAELEITLCPAVAHCPGCGVTLSVTSRVQACTQCGTWPLEIEDAEALQLIAIRGA